MKLADMGEPLAYEIAFSLAAVRSDSHPLAQLGALSMEVCEKLRALAIMVLLVKADVDRFHHNLIRSALVRERYLRRCQDEGALEDHHRASGRVGAFLDGLAAGELPALRRIAALSPVDLREGHEYEDDYCFAQILHRWVAEAPAEDEVEALIERWEAYLEGAEDARLLVCRALAARDQAAFDEAFEALLGRRERQIAAEKAREKLETPEVIAERHIHVEGLALLRLATMRGLSAGGERRMCPLLARAPMGAAFPGE